VSAIRLPPKLMDVTKGANQQKQLRNNVPHVKTSKSANNQLYPAKNENQPKKCYTPFFFLKAFN